MDNLQKKIEDIYKKVKKIKRGKIASYIPELAIVNPNIYGISICTVDGKIYSVGDYNKKVAIESVAKVFTLALALKENGINKINKQIGSSGSFLPFNSIIAADISPGHTINPFVNAGAMATTSLVENKNVSLFWKKIHNNLNDFAGKKLKLSTKLYKSEMKTNQHNKSLAYLLKSYGRFYGDVENTVDVYTKQGSVLVTSEDLSIMAATFANNGINPKTKKQIVDKKFIKYILGQMIGGGLYEYSDKWMIDIGIPAKSGVGGFIMAVVPGIMGICVVSPLLDEYGNSIKGIKTIEYLSKKLNLSILK
jgi:glutaminase